MDAPELLLIIVSLDQKMSECCSCNTMRDEGKDPAATTNYIMFPAKFLILSLYLQMKGAKL